MTEHTHESGVRFPENPDTQVEVAATFIESGNQMQMAIIGTEPVLLIQPEYNADEDKVTFLLTAVDLDPAGLVQVAEVLLDAANTMAAQQAAAIQEQIEADDALRAADAEFQRSLARKPDANGGSAVGTIVVDPEPEFEDVQSEVHPDHLTPEVNDGDDA
jgi:hypothetical protein